MPEGNQSLIQHYNNMRNDILAAIAGLSDDLLTESTLDGWSVKDHLAHLALWDDLRAGEITRVSAGFASAWRMAHERSETLNDMAYLARRDLSLAQVRWEFTTARQRVLDALAAAPVSALDPALYGEAALRSTHETEHTVWIRRWRARLAV